MPALAPDLRNQLDRVCQSARDKAEEAAHSALQKRAVDVAEPFPHFSAVEKEMRTRLRARGRQAGDVRRGDKTQSIEQLTQELAYEYWHRMLFARFLAENHLLMHPDGVAVSLDECNELAKAEAHPTVLFLAARYASRMLPQIFRTDDVLLEIEFAPEQRLSMEKLLASLPRETFLADDSLGWVYQFWQTKKKDEVNASGDKIDGRTLPAVTQLFTEDYMVQFLLHNTIGAWWCARHGIKGPPGGAGIPAGQAPVEMPYLRWRDDGTPVSGTFGGWPKSLKEFTMLDPCCGSGHFLVNAFNLLVPLRMHDEGLLAKDACDDVLRENLYGLELDPRCTQIAAFALALAAWRYPDAGSYRDLPQPNIACSGQGVIGKREEWTALANGDSRLRFSLDSLFDLFQKAPDLGSLINPRTVERAPGITGTFAELQPLLTKSFATNKDDADLTAVGVAALGIAKAAELLANTYVLVATNVPYLGSGNQSTVLKMFFKDFANEARFDLATVFLRRCLDFCRSDGTSCLVTPQNWLFQASYETLREQLLNGVVFNSIVRLGPRAFETISGEVVSVAMLVLTKSSPSGHSTMSYLDLGGVKVPQEKARLLSTASFLGCSQLRQLENPDSRITFGEIAEFVMLSTFANAWQGLATGDLPRFCRCFWELPGLLVNWRWFQSTVEQTTLYGGREQIVFWEDGLGQMKEVSQNPFRGDLAWGKPGVAVSQMATLPASLYTGDAFDNSMSVITPFDPGHVSAIWAYCTSEEYLKNIRLIDQSLKVTNASLCKVPFDLTHWQGVAKEKFPNGLPEPHSDDPTQWLFKGHIVGTTAPLQVGVACLLSYLWPQRPNDAVECDNRVDADGIVCLNALRSEAPAADRLLDILKSAYDKSWSNIRLNDLLTASGCRAGLLLEDWVRDLFFDQHCKLFRTRPFIWQIWDGRKDGFSCLVNCHKLNHKNLVNLTYSYLGDWIKAQTAEAKADKAGADLRLAAAQALQEKLKLILAGEPPYDIFVRWKPLHEQAIGWHPDLNDGVRMNIRPFVEADILRKKPNIKWTKDRGKEPERDKDDYPWFWDGKDFVGDRVNDVHLTNAEKQEARTRARKK